MCFFGTPAGDPLYEEGTCRCGPITAITSCMEFQEIRIAASNWPMNTRGPQFDPTSGERLIDKDRLAEARKYLPTGFRDERCAASEPRVCHTKTRPTTTSS